MPNIEVREFDQMVNDTMTRIANSTNISNTNPGSVVRTIVESLLAELDIQYYQINQLALAMDIDTAIGTDLDNIGKILGTTRNSATKYTTTTQVMFGRSEAYASDIAIPYGSIVSTLADSDGTTIEFVVTQTDGKLPAGALSVPIICTSQNAGAINIPTGVLCILNQSIVNIEYVNNTSAISGGSNEESDDDYRARLKLALSTIGKGTISAIETAVEDIDGVRSASCSTTGAGAATLIVTPNILPPTSDLQNLISSAVDNVKAAGVNITINYPTAYSVDITLTTTHFTTGSTIKSGIMAYISTLSTGDVLILDQIKRYIINTCGDDKMGISISAPTSDVTPSSSQVIQIGTVTINGSVV